MRCEELTKKKKGPKPQFKPETCTDTIKVGRDGKEYRAVCLAYEWMPVHATIERDDSKCKKDCAKEGKVCNPKTGKCILKNTPLAWGLFGVGTGHRQNNKILARADQIRQEAAAYREQRARERNQRIHASKLNAKMNSKNMALLKRLNSAQRQYDAIGPQSYAPELEQLRNIKQHIHDTITHIKTHNTHGRPHFIPTFTRHRSSKRHLSAGPSLSSWGSSGFDRDPEIESWLSKNSKKKVKPLRRLQQTQKKKPLWR